MLGKQLRNLVASGFVFCCMTHTVAAQDSFEQYQLQVLADTASIEVTLIDQVRGGCWKSPTYAKTLAEKRLLSNGVKIANGSNVFLRIHGLGFPDTTSSGKRLGCSVYVSMEAFYFALVPTPADAKKVVGQIKFYENGAILGGGSALDDRIAASIQQWADELSVLWLKARQK
jgi:hypothetical protein